IPAYQDYSQRAMTTEVMTPAAPARLAIAEFYASQGRLPNAEEAAGYSQAFEQGPVLRIDYDARLLRLVLELSPEAGLGDGAILELVPVLQDGMIIRWRCASPNLDESQLPGSCG
ncbi:MAG: pilin, partial [Pseudomonadota bacterium]